MNEFIDELLHLLDEWSEEIKENYTDINNLSEYDEGMIAGYKNVINQLNSMRRIRVYKEENRSKFIAGSYIV